MPYKSILKGLVDSTPGSIGAILVDWEGEAVQEYCHCDPYDIRFVAAHKGIILARLKELDVEVHVRSVFLQGLLFLENPPERLAFAAPMMKAARTRIAAAGITPMAAALAFVLSRPEVDLAVIGLTGLRQLEETLTAIATPAPELDWASFALSDTRVLTPSLW